MPRSSWPLALLVACAPAPVVEANVVGAASVKGASPASPSTAPVATPADDDGADDRACEAAMYTDHVAGTRGLHAFEDPTGLYGFADSKGVTVIPPRFRFVYEFSEHGVTAGVDLSGRPVFIDTGGNVLAQAYLFDNGPDYFSSGRARIVDRGKVGFIDVRGRVVVAARWDGATSYCGEHAFVCDGCARQRGDDADVLAGGAWGAIDRRGQVVVPLVHPDAGHAERALARRAP
ncbi:MAG: WG repeat-containing protein [Labilithrix sp.]|nr:WG repeat-containing protein [Labilithrix sp.]